MRSTLRIRIGSGSARAELLRRTQVMWAGEATFTTPQELGEAVGQLIAEKSLPAQPGGLQIELEPPLVQVRTLRGLPPVRSTLLRSLVATQSARFFRGHGKTLVIDACWTSRAARREGTAVAAAGQESWIEAALQGARAAGLRVEALRPADLPEGACLTLMPLAEQRQQQAQVILSLWRLALMASLTWVAAAGVFVGRVERERGRTDREITRLEPSARALQAARSALEEAARTVAVIESAAQDQDKVWSSIAVLATALPDSAFITDLRLDLAGRGGISVVALRSGIVLGAIDRAASGLSPRLEGAVLRETIAGRDWERFAIGFGQTSAR